MALVEEGEQIQKALGAVVELSFRALVVVAEEQGERLRFLAVEWGHHDRLLAAAVGASSGEQAKQPWVEPLFQTGLKPAA